MNDVPLSVLLGILLLLIIMSGFFSSSETSMMSLNRYRLRHLAKGKNKGAIRSAKLLEKPDRLIGTILTGNNLVNFAAASLATIIIQRMFPDNPDLAVILNTIVFTFIILIFAELTPKTVAAIMPEKIAFPVSGLLLALQWALHPAVWFVNVIANGLLKIFRVDVANATPDNLSTEELRTIVHEAGSMIPKRHQHMLLSILDLEKMTVSDIMVPRSEVFGIDIESPTEDILSQLRGTQHTRIPVYKGELNHVVGLLHTRNISRFLSSGQLLKEDIIEVSREPYFIPESTPLHIQLFNFQKNKRRIALVVDEYGDVEGICTLEDILEEIVGEFTTDVAAAASPDVHPQEDGSFVVDGSAFVRDVNKAMKWLLPTDGPKTISGLIVERMEHIPESPVCLVIDSHRIEILEIRDNMIKSAKFTLVPRPAPLA